MTAVVCRSILQSFTCAHVLNNEGQNEVQSDAGVGLWRCQPGAPTGSIKVRGRTKGGLAKVKLNEKAWRTD